MEEDDDDDGNVYCVAQKGDSSVNGHENTLAWG